MSAYDEDPYGQPYNPGQQPTPGAPNLQDPGLKEAVARFYQTILGRPPENDDVVNQWIQGKQGNLYAIQEAMKATPEAKAYASKGSETPNPVQPPPPPPGPTAPPPAAGGPPPGPNAGGTQAPPPTAGGPYTPPDPYKPPPAFEYESFKAPSKDDVLGDAQYQSLFNSGIQAIGAKNAALGTLNTGGTIKDFMGFGQDLASRSYGDIFNRKLTEYQTNRGNAIDTYNTNYGTQYRDPYAINYQSQYADPFAFGMQGAGLQQNNNQFNAQLGQNNNQFNSNLDWQKFLQQYKANVTDPFDRAYKWAQYA